MRVYLGMIVGKRPLTAVRRYTNLWLVVDDLDADHNLLLVLTGGVKSQIPFLSSGVPATNQGANSRPNRSFGCVVKPDLQPMRRLRVGGRLYFYSKRFYSMNNDARGKELCMTVDQGGPVQHSTLAAFKLEFGYKQLIGCSLNL